MVWLIVAGVVVVPLLALGATLAALRHRLAELDRVSALTQERLRVASGRLPGAVPPMQARLAGLNQRAAQTQERMAQLRAGRPGGTGPPR